MVLLARTVVPMTDTMIPPEAVSRLDFDGLAPGFAKAMAHLDHAAVKELDAAGIEPRLRELVRLRASQLNGCAFCVDMHTKDARAIGETEQRLYALDVWRETPFYDDRERAALTLTEATTLMADTHVPGDVYAEVAEVLSPSEIAAVLSLIVAINAWNAVGVTTRTWLPGSYEA